MTSPQPSSRCANRLFLYGPLALGALIFAIYTVIWFVGAGIMRDEVTKWIDGERARGNLVEHGKIKVQGYPFLLRARIDEPHYGTEDDGFHWQSDTLFIDTLPYNPNRLILEPRGTGILTLNNGPKAEKWRLASESLKTSLSQTAFGLDMRSLQATPLNPSALGVDAIAVERLIANTGISETEVGSLGGFALSAEKATLRAREDARNIALHDADIGVRVTGFELLETYFSGGTVSSWQENNGAIIIDRVRLNLASSLDAEPTRISVSGSIYVDDQLFPAGQLSVSISDQEQLFSILQAYGLVNADITGAINKLKSQGNMEIQNFELVMKNGELSIHPKGMAFLALYKTDLSRLN